MLSAHEMRIWQDLAIALGGFGRIADIAERRLSSLWNWRSGRQMVPVDAVDRLIEAVEGLPDESARIRLLVELGRWRGDAVARMAAGHAKTRQAFLQRFGHLPDDPAWQRGKVKKDAATHVLPGRSGIPRSRDRRDF